MRTGSCRTPVARGIAFEHRSSRYERLNATACRGVAPSSAGQPPVIAASDSSRYVRFPQTGGKLPLVDETGGRSSQESLGI